MYQGRQGQQTFRSAGSVRTREDNFTREVRGATAGSAGGTAGQESWGAGGEQRGQDARRSRPSAARWWLTSSERALVAAAPPLLSISGRVPGVVSSAAVVGAAFELAAGAGTGRFRGASAMLLYATSNVASGEQHRSAPPPPPADPGSCGRTKRTAVGPPPSAGAMVATVSLELVGKGIPLTCV